MITAACSRKTTDHSKAAVAAAEGATRVAVTLALALLLFAFWAVMHRYGGLNRDARVYALQALSRLHTNLASDLYLQNTSQDRYTVFSPLYAFFIKGMGLENSALLLTLVFTAWFMVATWAVAERAGSYQLAWLAAAMIVFTSGEYGAFRVFYFPEVYLTARLPAYAMVVTAIALHLWEYRRLALCMAAAALLVHPIMALPGLLVLICLTVSVRMSILGAAAGIILTVGIAAAAALLPAVARIVTVIDPTWLEIVRERSQFLFLQLWSRGDWELNARSFLCLSVTAAALPQGAARRLATAALLVGAAGIAVAFIAGRIGPVAILLQGQAWRWVWMTSLIAVLLLPQTVQRIWSTAKCGPICSMFLLLSWTFSAVDGTLCAAIAVFLWSIRRHVTLRLERLLRFAAVVLGVIVVAWAAATAWNIAVSASAESGGEPLVLTKLRNVLSLQISAVLLFGGIWYWTIRRRFATGPLVLCAVLLAGSAFALRMSFEQIDRLDSAAYLAEFAEWRAAIPESSTVFVAPAQDTGTFVWFALQRPNYLTVDQSAGVVFSRATALEVKRRSGVLLPVEDPNWKLLSAMSRGAHGAPKAGAARNRPLTARSLSSLCEDPVLGFVVSKEHVGQGPVLRMDHGKWKDWNLYDCRAVRSRVPAA